MSSMFISWGLNIRGGKISKHRGPLWPSVSTYVCRPYSIGQQCARGGSPGSNWEGDRTSFDTRQCHSEEGNTGKGISEVLFEISLFGKSSHVISEISSGKEKQCEEFPVYSRITNEAFSAAQMNLCHLNYFSDIHHCLHSTCPCGLSRLGRKQKPIFSKNINNTFCRPCQSLLRP